jgi:hypothetical protein
VPTGPPAAAVGTLRADVLRSELAPTSYLVVAYWCCAFSPGLAHPKLQYSSSGEGYEPGATHQVEKITRRSSLIFLPAFQ